MNFHPPCRQIYAKTNISIRKLVQTGLLCAPITPSTSELLAKEHELGIGEHAHKNTNSALTDPFCNLRKDQKYYREECKES